eukprot:11516099-Alexandrium_andersonii.AAC.1
MVTWFDPACRLPRDAAEGKVVVARRRRCFACVVMRACRLEENQLFVAWGPSTHSGENTMVAVCYSWRLNLAAHMPLQVS